MGEWVIVPFAKTYDRRAFTCGEADLDEWLQRYSSQSERSGNTRTFFGVDDKQVLGYYSQRTFQVEPDDAARMLGVGNHRYPMPAILIARLAVDTRYQGAGVGTRLLIDALHRIARLSTEIGFEVVVVHALSHDVSVFYRRAGFHPAQDQPLHLYLPVRDLRLTFGISRPCTYLVSTLVSEQGATMPTNNTSAKEARLNMRITAEALDTIKEAAAIQQQDLTSFVLGAAMERARTVLAEERILRLSPHDITQLEAMLDREPQVIPQLAALLNRYGNPSRPSVERENRVAHA